MTGSFGKAPPRVSVVIPCHDREATVREAVESVLDQDVRDIEVIAVDDRSTDATRDVLDGIDDPRLRVEANTGPQGPSGARNHGAALARAPWIAFQDSDDIWLPGKLAAQMAAVEGGDFVAVYCGMLVKEDARPETAVQTRYPPPGLSPLSGDILPSLVRQSYISTQMLAVRRDAFEDVGGFDGDLPVLVDWEFMLRLAQRGPVAFVDRDLVVQRMSPNSVTHNSRKRLDAQDYILRKHGDLIARYPGALEHHHHRLAGGYRRFGQYAAAARHAAHASRGAPGRFKYRLNAIYLKTRALFA